MLRNDASPLDRLPLLAVALAVAMMALAAWTAPAQASDDCWDLDLDNPKISCLRGVTDEVMDLVEDPPVGLSSYSCVATISGVKDTPFGDDESVIVLDGTGGQISCAVAGKNSGSFTTSDVSFSAAAVSMTYPPYACQGPAIIGGTIGWNPAGGTRVPANAGQSGSVGFGSYMVGGQSASTFGTGAGVLDIVCTLDTFTASVTFTTVI